MMSQENNEDWASYLCRVNDKPASIFIDLALKTSAPLPGAVNLMIVWLQMNEPRTEDGLSSQQESKTLFTIEDALTPAVVDKCSAVFTGRITTDGRREFYFYAASIDGFEEAVRNAMLSFPAYRYEAWTDADPNWEQYFNVLYPSASNLRWIHDSRVIDQLEKHGDQLHLPRKIDHFAYFTSAADREAFVRLVLASGFSIERKSEPESEAEKYGLSFFKVQSAELNDIFETTSFLEKETVNLKGEYDGWGSEITKSEKSFGRFIKNFLKR